MPATTDLREKTLPAYKKLPTLSKPPKRSLNRALPTALHIAATSTLSVLLVGAINIAVTMSLGERNMWSRLVQSGTLVSPSLYVLLVRSFFLIALLAEHPALLATQMAMVTITVLALPHLGGSVNKGLQRICGVMVGGWLFFGLYAACQLWWFLAVCLAVWAFILVAASYALSGNQFLFPVALVTAFIVATNFSSVQQALIMTLVKTIAISGAIILYTIVSMLLFPLTATQQVINALADTLEALQQLAAAVLLGQPGGSPHGAAEAELDGALGLAASGSAKACEPEMAGDAVGAEVCQDTKNSSNLSHSQGAVTPETQPPADAKPEVSLLAAKASHHLQMVTQLLPATKKERYAGSCGSYKCFLPAVRTKNKLDETLVMAVSVNAVQVLRTLMTMGVEFGSVPLARRPPAADVVGPEALPLVQQLAELAQAAMQDIAQALPVNQAASTAIPVMHVNRYAETLQLLISATVSQPTQSSSTQSQAAAAKAKAGSNNAGFTDVSAAKWQQTAAAAAGMTRASHKEQQLNSQQILSAFGDLMNELVMQEEAHMAQWCSTLILCRQLGKALVGLTSSVNSLLPVLPGVSSR